MAILCVRSPRTVFSDNLNNQCTWQNIPKMQVGLYKYYIIDVMRKPTLMAYDATLVLQLLLSNIITNWSRLFKINGRRSLTLH